MKLEGSLDSSPDAILFCLVRERSRSNGHMSSLAYVLHSHGKPSDRAGTLQRIVLVHAGTSYLSLQSFDKVTRQVRGAITLAIENKRSVWLATTATTCICHRPPHGALAPAQLLSLEGSQRPGMKLPSWISAKPVPANMGRWGPLPKLSLGYLALHSHLPDDLLFFKKKALHGKELVGREGDSCARHWNHRLARSLRLRKHLAKAIRMQTMWAASVKTRRRHLLEMAPPRRVIFSTRSICHDASSRDHGGTIGGPRERYDSRSSCQKFGRSCRPVCKTDVIWNWGERNLSRGSGKE